MTMLKIMYYWPANTTLIAGDSILHGVKEIKLKSLKLG